MKAFMKLSVKLDKKIGKLFSCKNVCNLEIMRVFRCRNILKIFCYLPQVRCAKLPAKCCAVSGFILYNRLAIYSTLKAHTKKAMYTFESYMQAHNVSFYQCIVLGFAFENLSFHLITEKIKFVDCY